MTVGIVPTERQCIGSAGRRLRVRSALNPMVWLCSTVSVPLLLAAAFADAAPTWLLVVVVVIAIAPVITAVGAFAYFARTAPSRLQSEGYGSRKTVGGNPAGGRQQRVAQTPVRERVSFNQPTAVLHQAARRVHDAIRRSRDRVHRSRVAASAPANLWG